MPDSADGPRMIGPGDLPEAVPVHSAPAMVPTIVQDAMTAAGEEGNDPSDSSLIKAACTVSTTLGYELKKVSRGEGCVRAVVCCMTLITSHQFNFGNPRCSLCTCVLKISPPAQYNHLFYPSRGGSRRKIAVFLAVITVYFPAELS